MINRLVAGIFSMILIGTVIIAPVYIAEQLEKIETSMGGLIPLDEILENSTSNTTYTPYQQFNQLNEGTYDNQGDHVGGYAANGAARYDPLSKTYDYSIYLDSFTYSDTSLSSVMFEMKVDWATVQSDGVYNLYILFDPGSGKTWNIAHVRALNTNADYVAQVPITYLAIDSTTEYTGEGYQEYTITTTEMNDMVSRASGYGLDHQLLEVAIIANYNNIPSMDVDIQLNPHHFSQTETTWNNQTIITYEPYIQTITPYAVHKVSMGIGGILIFAVGWIASPWGERFDKFLPINSTTRRKRSK